MEIKRGIKVKPQPLLKKSHLQIEPPHGLPARLLILHYMGILTPLPGGVAPWWPER